LRKLPTKYQCVLVPKDNKQKEFQIKQEMEALTKKKKDCKIFTDREINHLYHQKAKLIHLGSRASDL